MKKWIYSFVTFVLAIFFAQFVVIKGISALLSNSSKDLKVEVEKLVGTDTKFNSENIVISDVLFPAWNDKDRHPLFFSLAHKKGSLSNRTEYDNMSLSQMITASASNQVYFNPYVFESDDGKENIIGGGSIAESPAMYSFFSADQFLKVDPKKISMTVVGALHKDTAKISGNVNPI